MSLSFLRALSRVSSHSLAVPSSPGFSQEFSPVPPFPSLEESPLPTNNAALLSQSDRPKRHRSRAGEGYKVQKKFKGRQKSSQRRRYQATSGLTGRHCPALQNLLKESLRSSENPSGPGSLLVLLRVHRFDPFLSLSASSKFLSSLPFQPFARFFRRFANSQPKNASEAQLELSLFLADRGHLKDSFDLLVEASQKRPFGNLAAAHGLCGLAGLALCIEAVEEFRIGKAALERAALEEENFSSPGASPERGGRNSPARGKAEEKIEKKAENMAKVDKAAARIRDTREQAKRSLEIACKRAPSDPSWLVGLLKLILAVPTSRRLARLGARIARKERKLGKSGRKSQVDVKSSSRQSSEDLSDSTENSLPELEDSELSCQQPRFSGVSSSELLEVSALVEKFAAENSDQHSAAQLRLEFLLAFTPSDEESIRKATVRLSQADPASEIAFLSASELFQRGQLDLAVYLTIIVRRLEVGPEDKKLWAALENLMSQLEQRMDDEEEEKKIFWENSEEFDDSAEFFDSLCSPGVWNFTGFFKLIEERAALWPISPPHSKEGRRCIEIFKRLGERWRLRLLASSENAVASRGNSSDEEIV